jgi:hypothetical protein
MGNRHSLVVVKDASQATSWRDAHFVVRTMLDMIDCLDRAGSALMTVVLGGEYASDLEIAAFLRETYPTVDVIAASA